MPAPGPKLAEMPRALPDDARLYLRPVALLSGVAAQAMVGAEGARPLAGGPLAFSCCEVVIRWVGHTQRALASIPEIERWAAAGEASLRDAAEGWLDRLSAPRPSTTARPSLMGIVNVTPDSFSDGGESLDPAAACAHAVKLAEEGAAIVDVGAESTRPGATPVDTSTELARIEPALRRLAGARSSRPGLRLSVDTRRAAVMRRALALGWDMINDISALADDPESVATAAASPAQVVLVHKRGEPAEMNLAPRYGDVALDVFDELQARIETCEAASLDRSRLIVDPGIGFAKRSAENLAVLRSLSLFHGLGCPVLVGLSRKALIGGEQRRLGPKQRLPGSLGAAFHALDQGVQILRVHDVAETRQVVDLWCAINNVA